VSTLATVGIVAAGLAGCGSSSGEHSTPATSDITPVTTAPTTSTQSVVSPPGSAPPSGTLSGSSGDPAAIAAVKDAFTKFFQPDTPEKVSLGLLQNGAKFKSTIEQQAGGSMASNATVSVSKVDIVSPTVADVTYTISVNGSPLLPNAKGYAVNTDGTWQISEYTFCGLLTLEGSAPAECKSPTATQTPQ
jgi:hypothetical protein